MALTENFRNQIAELCAGYIPLENAGLLSDRIQRAGAKYHFTVASENNFLRILKSVFNRTTFLNDLLNYDHHLEVVTGIAANSNFLTDIVVRNPGILYRAFDPGMLEARLDEDRLTAEVFRSIKNYKTEESRRNYLRNIKKRELFVIGVRDFLHLGSVKDITEDLSKLARALSTSLFFSVLKDSIKTFLKTDIPFPDNKLNDTSGAENKVYSSFVVIALGKFGGNELNYSSDIDLMAMTSENLTFENGVTLNEILADAVRNFTTSGSEMTSEGYLYRIDFRLRPDGKSAPLVRTLRETVHYYETRGEPWERQMLIKAGFVCGNRELYDKFISSVRPFVYPATHLKPPLEQLKRLRENMVLNLKDDRNIKLSKGGIRDIEFGVQALQLIFGGKIPQVRDCNTLSAIDKLNEAGLLANEEAMAYSAAYELYRDIEHYLQLMNDTQTHSIPEKGEITEKLAVYLGYETPEILLHELDTLKQKVRKIYESITGTESAHDSGKQPFSAVSFTDKKGAARNILFLGEGKGLTMKKEFDSRTTEAFHRITPVLEKYLESSGNPDLVLSNFARIMQFAGLPSVYYDVFEDSPVLFTDFLKLTEISQKSVDLLTEQPDLKDFILSGRIGEYFSPATDFSLSMRQISFILASGYALGYMSREEVSAALSSVVSLKIRSAADDYFSENPADYEWFAAVMGSASVSEMRFSSDIDLFFLVSDISAHPEAYEHFTSLFNIIAERLSPFKVDCRLRPEGKNSPIVSDIQGYRAYLASRIQIWELQALTRINQAAGSHSFFTQFTDAVTGRISEVKRASLQKDIKEMRNRLVTSSSLGFSLKKNKGTITDCEFAAQYLLLSHPGLFNLLKGKSYHGMIERLKNAEDMFREIQSEIINSDDLLNLYSAFSFFKEAEMAQEVLFNTSGSVVPNDSGKQEKLSAFIKIQNVQELNRLITAHTRTVSDIFTKVFG